MELYEKIRERRKALNITQDELAKMTGYKDRSSIAKIETGVISVPSDKIKLFAKALSTTPYFLLDNDTTLNCFTEDMFGYNSIFDYQQFLDNANSIISKLPVEPDMHRKETRFAYAKAVQKTLIEQSYSPDILEKSDCIIQIPNKYINYSQISRLKDDGYSLVDKTLLQKNIYITLVKEYAYAALSYTDDVIQCQYILQSLESISVHPAHYSKYKKIITVLDRYLQ